MLETEGDPPAPSQIIKRKRTKAVTQSKTKGKVAKKAAESFSREELNLRLDLHPVSFYVSDRDNLVDQLFTILSGDELQKMIPATLQGYSLAEIRERVTLEAKKYEDDDIYKIIHDAVPNLPKPRKDTDIATHFTAFEGDLQAGDETSSEPLPKSQHDTLELCPDQGEIDSLIDTESKDTPTSSALNVEVETDTVKLKPNDNEIQKQPEPNEDMTNLSGVGTEWVSSLARSQLEILELEMRARAIRSLMKAQGMPVPDDESEEETEIGEQDLQEEDDDDDDEEESEESRKLLVELPESEMLRGNIGVDDRVEETEERGTEVESDSVSSECETCASERDIVVVPQQEESPGDDLRKVETSAMEIVTTIEKRLVEPTVTLVETEREVAREERVIVEVVPEEEIMEEETPTKTMEEEVEKLVSMMLLKVVSDEVEASEKRERRNRRQLRRKNAKIMDSDMEEGQIQDDSDSNDLSE